MKLRHYLLAQDVAKETGLLGALDRVSGDRPVALEFARETDRRLSFPAVPVLDLSPNPPKDGLGDSP